MSVEANAVRDLLQTATPQLRGVDVDDVAALVTEQAAAGRSRRARWSIAAAVTAVLIIAVGITLTRHDAAAPSSTPSTSPTDYSRLVLRDGDTVSASGQVVALPGQPVQLCDPDQASGGISSPARARIDPCIGIDVVGLDLSRLSSRYVVDGGVSGYADVTGTYRGGRIILTHQGPFTSHPGPSLDVTNFHHSPCPAPAGGWPKSGQPLLDEVAAYGRTHPGSIVTEAVLRPTRTASIGYVLTSGDPEAVRHALAKSVRYGLCVMRSRYTRQQIDAAGNAFTPAPDNGITMAGLDGLGNDLQPQVSVWMRQLTPELAAAAARQPQGLLKLTIWLTPKH